MEPMLQDKLAVCAFAFFYAQWCGHVHDLEGILAQVWVVGALFLFTSLGLKINPVTLVSIPSFLPLLACGLAARAATVLLLGVAFYFWGPANRSIFRRDEGWAVMLLQVCPWVCLSGRGPARRREAGGAAGGPGGGGGGGAALRGGRGARAAAAARERWTAVGDGGARGLIRPPLPPPLLLALLLPRQGALRTRTSHLWGPAAPPPPAQKKRPDTVLVPGLELTTPST